MWWILWIVAALACAFLGGYVAFAKGRIPGEGVMFGLVLGPLGILVEVLMPTLHAVRLRLPRAEPDEPDAVDVDLWDTHEIMGMPRVDP